MVCYTKSSAFVELSIQFAEDLESIHTRCFDVFWSTKDFYELLSLPSVFGFIAILTNENAIEYEDFSKSEPNVAKSCYLGFILCLVGGEECEILTICVLPEWRRKRLAVNLIQNATTRAKKLNAKKVLLEVAEDNEAARNLYINLGFEEFGRRNQYYKKKGLSDAIQYRKVII